MDGWVMAESKPVVSGLALWAYRIATWPLAICAPAVVFVFLASSARWESNDLLYLPAISAAVVLLIHSFILAPVALALGIAALIQARRHPGRYCGREYAKVAVIVSLVVCAYVALMYIEGWPMT